MDLNIVADVMTFADAFADVEPAQNFNRHQCVEPSLSDRDVLPGTIFRTSDQLSQTWNRRQIVKHINIDLTSNRMLDAEVVATHQREWQVYRSASVVSIRAKRIWPPLAISDVLAPSNLQWKNGILQT